MAEPRTSAPTPNHPPTPAGGKQALLEAAQEVVRKQAEDRAAEIEAERRARSRVSPVVAVGCAVLLVVGAYVAVERPTWIFPKPSAVETVEVREASLRIGMAATAQRIEKFRQLRNRLPHTLAETGGIPHGIRSERTGTQAFALYGSNGPVALTLRSTDSLRTFVGSSFEVIARRTGR
ncbi:MAG TPA: hypothetical protein VFM14_07065 [Gemmatimonadales bacterium]|nr:hypothetical protein [Gemmatimonadales bacterium]